ncbi:MAG TPA: hypothetical protein VHS97_22410, partial [Isosphaeraceae bacterium]|nr:hypothetical protein [Isosphaeraceae bacterium]
MKHLPRRTIRVSALIVILMGWSSPSLSAHADDEAGGDAATIYTASDFTWLAQGVDPGFTGPATLRVWAPPRDNWRLTEADGVLTLILASKEGDPEPQWRTLGNVTLSQRKPLKIVVARDSADGGDKGPETPQDHPQSKTAKAEAAKSKQPLPVPALLLVSARPDIDTRATHDIVRGRTDSIEPTNDQRRTRVRTNWQGADFQAPQNVAAWQDRKRHLREQMLVALGLWPMFPKTPLAPKISGKLNRDQYTIEKVVLETFPGFTLSGNLYRPINQRGRAPAIMCPHGHWDDGRVNPEVQQRCIRWAKLGCVVFLYDMVG